MNKKAIAITGANGFIAGHLIKFLAGSEYSVRAVIRKGSKLREPLHAFVSSTHEYSDSKSLEVAFEGVEAVFHLGALFSKKEDLATQEDLVKSNILFTADIIAAMNAVASNAVLIGAETFSSYNETNEISHKNLYTITKTASMELAKLFSSKALYLVFSDTYGPEDTRPKLQNLIRDGKISQMQSPAEQKINTNHVEDICRAMMYAYVNYESLSEHFTYDLMYSENELTLGELVQALGANVSFGNTADIVGIPTNINKMPGFKLKYNTYKDIKETIEVKS